MFPDDPTEWEDNDLDDIGDNVDIYDGNGAIKVTITKFESDGYSDTNEDDGIPDPGFYIRFEYWFQNLSLAGSYTAGPSSVFIDQQKISNPYSFALDVPDNIFELKVQIQAYDFDYSQIDGKYIQDEEIDLNGNNSAPGGNTQHYSSNENYPFYPRISSYALYSDDGKLDLKNGEMDGYVEWTIEVVCGECP